MPLPIKTLPAVGCGIALALRAWCSLAALLAAEPRDGRPDIAPLLARRCLSCHASEDPQGGLDLTQRSAMLRGGDSGPALVPGEPTHSLLWQRITAGEMPPKQALSVAEQQQFREWITAGAELAAAIDPLRYSSESRAGYDWWSLQPKQHITVPSDPTGWSQNPVDAFIQQRRLAAGLSAAAAAEPQVLLRRLSQDLLGLPPTLADVAEFTQHPTPQTYAAIVDRWLASPHYGERWGRHWLDVVRFGESNGFERDLPRPNAWPYRDWVIEALNQDMPYDEFVRQQLAGDVIAPDESDGLRALGFLVAGPHDTVIPVSNRMRQTMRQDEMEDLIGVVGQTFLGLTVNCARCHDHKFDPISARDYYQLAAVFAGIDHAERTSIAPSDQQQLDAWKQAQQRLERLLAEQTAAALTRRKTASRGTAPETLPPESKPSVSEQPSPEPVVVLPTPIGEWDFTVDLQDRRGRLHGQWIGPSRRGASGLELDGTNYVVTEPLTSDVREKTLEVRVRSGDWQQRGGGVISLQTLDGAVFDAIVFAEQQALRWLAGSNFFQRTSAFEGPPETATADEWVTLSYVYAGNGSITAYRNGRPYGRSYQTNGPVLFRADQSQILFGLRHGSAGGNRLFRGQIASARLYDRALTPHEVQAAARQSGPLLTEDDVVSLLTPAEQSQRQQWQRELAERTQQWGQLNQTAPRKIYTANPSQPVEMRVLRRGSVDDPGEVVSPAGLSSLVEHGGDLQLKPTGLEGQRRLRLAEWLTSSRNALFARVMVNRVWHYHFGRGLVPTPNDLGFNGGEPSHPELLEWLAGEFIDSGYSLKALHRLIVTSATYQQSSKFDAQSASRDADNRWLWRMSPRRLDAETLRDSLLCVTEELNDVVGGPSYADFHSHLFKGTQFYEPRDFDDFAVQRRTVYRMWARGGRNPFLDTFDCPDPSTTTPARSATTTPLQALALFNNPFVRRRAARLANLLRQKAGAVPAAQIEQAYLRLFCRHPTPDEQQFCIDFLRENSLEAACLAWLNSSEFVYLD